MKIPSPKPRVELNGLPTPAKLPWDEALLINVRRLEARAEKAERENAELRASVAKLRGSLAEAKRRLENWRLRQQAWRVERAELLEKINTFSSAERRATGTSP